MTDVYVVRTEYTCPPSVIRPCTVGGTCYIGFLDDKTVLKYPTNEDNRYFIDVEARIFDALGSHPRILRCFGTNEDGLILEYAPHGSVKQYLEKTPSTSMKQRVTWCRELVEAMVHMHSKYVLHCNISAGNLFLDESLSSKLADFQGTLKDPATGAPVVTGGITEMSKWYLRRAEGAESVELVVPFNYQSSSSANGVPSRSDLFALGTAIHEIVLGYEPFPELTSDMDDEVIQARFVAGQFPDVGGIPGGEVMLKCWRQQYGGAHECLADLVALEEQC